MDKLIYKRIGAFVGAGSLLPAILIAWGLFLLSSVPVSAQSDAGRTAVNQDMTIEKGDVVKGNAVVTGGNITVLGEVRGDVVVAKGNAKIQGTVHGDVTVTDGNVELGPKSVVEGNVLAVVGKVVRDPSARVTGTVNAPSISLEGVTNAVLPPGAPQPPGKPGGGDTSGSAPSIAGSALAGLIQLFGKGMISVVLLILGLLLVAVVPGRVSLSSATLEAAPVPSLIVGMITAFLLFPVSAVLGTVLLISIVGSVFLPVLAVGILVMLLFGLVTVSTWIGRSVYASVHQGNHVAVNHLFVHVLLGMSIVLGMTLVPSVLLPGSVSVLMLLLLYFASCVGIASAILSRFGTLVPPKHAHYYQVPMQGTQANYGAVAPTPQPATENKPAAPFPPDPGFTP